MSKIILFLSFFLISGITTSCVLLTREHEEAMAVPISNINFSVLKDGNYTGYYEGGMYGWRENRVQVTVESGRLTRVNLLSCEEDKPAEFTDDLYSRVIQNQSLQVDARSGATLTTKALLKGLESALLQANPY